MTKDPLETIWPAIAADLRDAVGASDYDVWLAPLRVAVFDGGSLVLRAPDETLAWVTDRFAGLVEAEVRRRSGADVEVRFVGAGEALQPTNGRPGRAANARTLR